MVHMDTMGTNGGPEGAPNIVKKWLRNGFQREKMKKTDHYMCPDEQKNAIFKDLNPHKHTQIMKTIFFASMGQVTDRIRGKGPYEYIWHE